MTISTSIRESLSTKGSQIPTKCWKTYQNNWPSPLTQNRVQHMINDVINHPQHYIEGRKYEPIAVIEDWELPYHLGNSIKYISRAGRKDASKTCEDLRKAVWYINRYIELVESKGA